ncbi:MAG: VWA domain-containing protein [Roseiarcus sp.]|jgi:Ca-activated chloride channel homolog
MNERLNLTVAIDRALAWAEGDSVRYVVASLAGTASADAAKSPAPAINLALVIDASGSMAGDKLENAKAAALGVAERLGPADKLSVVSFADDVVVHVEAQTPSGEAMTGIRAAIGALRTRGNTNLSEGWLTGAECVARAAREGAVNRVILLSDGAANAGIIDPAGLAVHAAELAKRGVATSCVGIGDGYETAVLRAIAESGGGRLHDAEVGSEIVDALMGELGEIGDLVAQDVSISLHVPATARAEFVGSAPTQVGAGFLSVSAGVLLAGRPRSCVFRVTLPAGRVGDTLLFGVSARGAAPGGASLDIRPAEASIAFVDGVRNTKQPRDEAASMAVALAWHAEIVRRAAQLNRGGERRQARRFVERELQYFERYCAGLPQAMPLVREITVLKQNVDRQWDERTRKEMELGAYLSAANKQDYRPSRANWSTRLNDGK